MSSLPSEGNMEVRVAFRLWGFSVLDLTQPVYQAKDWIYGYNIRYFWANNLGDLRVHKTSSNVSTSKGLIITLRDIHFKTDQSVRYTTIESNVYVCCVQVWLTISSILFWRRGVDSWRVWTCAALPTYLQTMLWTLLVRRCMHGVYRPCLRDHFVLRHSLPDGKSARMSISCRVYGCKQRGMKGSSAQFFWFSKAPNVMRL